MRADTTSSRARRTRPRALLAGLLLPALALGALGACGGDDDEAGSDDTTTTTTAPDADAPAGGDETAAAEGDISWVAHARNPTIDVYDQPDTPDPTHTLDNPNELGAPLVFLVDSHDPTTDWLPVHLPIRPNGTTGYIRATDAELVQIDYRITIELADHQLTVTQAGNPIITAPIGVGTQDTPTPGGTYYLKELLQPPDPTGPYGTYAYGLSGFSNQLESFNGGDGVIGIHGTNQPDTIGQDVSHGCIRVTNDTIDQMAAILPLGTPVDIRE